MLGCARKLVRSYCRRFEDLAWLGFSHKTLEMFHFFIAKFSLDHLFSLAVIQYLFLFFHDSVAKQHILKNRAFIDGGSHWNTVHQLYLLNFAKCDSFIV